MRNILSMMKTEIFNLYSTIDELVKKVTKSQASYLKDRGNEDLYKQWSENVKDLQKAESNLRYLKTAYATVCEACEVEPMTVEEIVAEKTEKAARKSARKASQKEEPVKQES